MTKLKQWIIYLADILAFFDTGRIGLTFVAEGEPARQIFGPQLIAKVLAYLPIVASLVEKTASIA